MKTGDEVALESAGDSPGESGLRAALAGLRYGARSALSPRVVQGAAVEVGWVTAHLAMYPLGLLRNGNHRAEGSADREQVHHDGLERHHDAVEDDHQQQEGE